MKKIYLKPTVKTRHIMTPCILAGSNTSMTGGGDGIEGLHGQSKFGGFFNSADDNFTGITGDDSNDYITW